MADDPDTVVNKACLQFKEGKHEEARVGFMEAMAATGYQPLLAYNIALCYYETKQYGLALKTLNGACARPCGTGMLRARRLGSLPPALPYTRCIGCISPSLGPPAARLPLSSRCRDH